MAAKLSYEEVRRLARIWFADARKKSEQDETEVTACKNERHKWNSYSGDRDALDSGGGGSGGKG